MQPTNRPRLSETQDEQPILRKRAPSYYLAKMVNEQTLISINNELEEFEPQQYLNLPPDQLPSIDIRSRYRKLLLRGPALLIGLEDHIPLLLKQGPSQEEVTLKEEINSVITQTTSILP